MKIKASKLKTFVKKASLNGEITTINLNFTETGLTTCVTDILNTTLTSTSLDTKAFEGYESIGEIFIKNAPALILHLDSFADVISLSLEGDYMLKINDNDREVFVILGASVVCENVHKGKLPDLKTTVTETLTKSNLTRVVKDTKDIKVNMVVINKTKNQLSLEVGKKGESDYSKNIIKTETKGEAKVCVGQMFLNVYNILDDKFTLKLGNDLPIIIEEETENIKFICIIAPINMD